ncbi:hypothetical protein JEQ12_004820 [Ovis aries]|uniref:Uncharacterized protein n=1 Tax=Ovis aries TaxID=9940 RepID=A0A836A2R1_SHEEP|nr:hypothetical protein JEQ12_004820 [Ovis aries]
MAGKVFAKSSLIETETPDVINFADTRSSVVSGERQWRLLTHRLGAMGPGLFLQGRFISQLPSWHYHVGWAVLRVDGGPSTFGGASSFQTCTEFSERILLWNFRLTAQNLIFLTISPWGRDVDLKG